MFFSRRLWQKFQAFMLVTLFIIIVSDAKINSSNVSAYLGADINSIQSFSGKVPIKWALITLGEYDYYYRLPQFNPTQKTENWIQSRGVPYDEFPDDLIEAPQTIPHPEISITICKWKYKISSSCFSSMWNAPKNYE